MTSQSNAQRRWLVTLVILLQWATWVLHEGRRHGWRLGFATTCVRDCIRLITCLILTFRSDREGNKRKSFTVYEDDMDCMSCSFKQPKFPIELGSSRNVPTVAGSKNATLERCRTLNDGGKWEQIAPTLVGQQEPKLHILESFTAFRARNKGELRCYLLHSLHEGMLEFYFPYQA